MTNHNCAEHNHWPCTKVNEMHAKVNSFDIAQDIIDEIQEHYTASDWLDSYNGDVLLAIDGMLSHTTIQVPSTAEVQVRARLGRWLRY